MTYNEALSATTAGTSAFAVTVGGVARTVSSVTISGSTVSLTLSPAVLFGETVTVAYTDPTAGNDANAIQDSAGNDAATRSATSVTNNVGAINGTIPIFGSVASLDSGFTVTIINYDPLFSYSVTVPSPATVTISNTGVIVVVGLVGFSISTRLTVVASRSGYTTETVSIDGSTKSAPPPPNYVVALTNPTLTKVDDSFTCVTGSYEFIRAAINKEAPKVSLFIFTLIIDNRRVSQVSTDGAASSVYVSPSAQEYPATANMSQATFRLGTRTDILPAQCEVTAYQENALNVSNSNILAKKTPSVSWSEILPITSTTKLSSQQLNASADVEGTFSYNEEAGSTLKIGKYSLTVTFTPKDLDNYQVVTVKNSLRVLVASTSIRNLVKIQPPQKAIQIRLSSGTLAVDLEMTLGGKATAGSAGFGIERLSVLGSTVTVWPVKGFTGKTTLSLVQSGDGGIINIVQPLLIAPASIIDLNVNTKQFLTPTLTWTSIPGAIRYKIANGSQVLCNTSVNSCSSKLPIGPKSALTATVFGKDLSQAVSSIIPLFNTSAEAYSISFKSGSTTLDSASVRQLEKFARSIQALGYARITLIGHADSSGGVDNLAISKSRAALVQKVLQRLLPGLIISAKGVAARQPIASNDTESGKAKNRRVEIRVSN